MRKTDRVTVPFEGRDKDKVFVITEMSAARAEKWAARALLLLVKSGVELPEDVANAGMAGIASAGIQALMNVDFDDAEPLLDEMLTCVQINPDPSRPAIVRNLVDDDTEEVSTRVWLRQKVFELHVGFSLADSPLPSGESAKTDESAVARTSSSVMSTFRRRSAR
jgi:hypothetical protein